MLHGWMTALSGRSDLDIQWQWWFAISVADTGGKMNPKPKGGVNVLRMLYCVCICNPAALDSAFRDLLWDAVTSLFHGFCLCLPLVGSLMISTILEWSLVSFSGFGEL